MSNSVELRGIVNATPENERNTPRFATLLNNLSVQTWESNPAEANFRYQQSRAIWEKTLGPEHPYVALSIANLAALFRKIGEFHEAERQFQAAQHIWKKSGHTLPKTDPEPLSAEYFNPAGVLEQYGADVRRLRAGVEAGSSEALRTLQWTIERLGPWYHNISFAGLKTNGVWPDFPDSRWRLIEPLIPADLSGKTVLDIGCNSGFFALEMKKRGAKRVIGIDIMQFELAQARFNSHWQGLPIELYDLDLYRIEEIDTKFDIILFLGVLYHLKHPLYALEKLASLCTDTMFLISSVRGSHGEYDPADDYPGDNGSIFENPDYPRMYFVEKKYNGDDTNWWLPNHSCLKAMARACGFSKVENTSDPQFIVCRK